MYLKLSSRNIGEATEISADEVESKTQGLEEIIPSNSKIDASHIHMQLARDLFESDDRKKAPVMVAKSWRVSPEEFIVKIDASPLHQSAARRMFNKNTTKEIQQELPSAKEDKEQEEEDDEEPSDAHRSEWGEFWDNMTTLFFTGSAPK